MFRVSWVVLQKRRASGKLYAESVTEELNSLEGVFLSWDVVAELLKRVALRVVGPIQKRDHRPWLRGKESEITLFGITGA